METETVIKIKSAVPKIRFKEFEENWRINKIGSFVKERSVTAQSELPLYSLTIENGVVPKSKRYERSFLVKGKGNAYKMMLPGDFAFNPMNLRFGALAKYKGKKEIAVSKYYNIFYCLGNSNPAFMEYYLTRYNMIQYYNKMSTGTLEEKKRVHYSDFVNFKKLFPSLPEQQKIASFLTAVDKKIQQLNHKKALLEIYKKGVMQKLFSQEIRFRDENGKEFPEWKKRRLIDVGEIITGSTPPTADASYYDGKRLFVSPADIDRCRHIMETKTKISDKGVKKGRLIKKGAVLFVCIGSTIGKVAQAGENCITNQQINSIEANLDNSNDFVYALLTYYGKKIKRLAGVQAVPQINKTDFSNLKFSFPSLEEQQKIADFLSAIDLKIEAVSQQIEKTQTFKKGLLQQMFV
jgi:type I restriction enzyme S subunit